MNLSCAKMSSPPYPVGGVVRDRQLWYQMHVMVDCVVPRLGAPGPNRRTRTRPAGGFPLPRRPAAARSTAALACALVLAGCGGGEGPSVSDPIEQRVTAARETAERAGACQGIRPFYWEIGDVNGRLVSGGVGLNPPTATTQMSIASASKWVYAAYAIERRGATGPDKTRDVPFLNFTSGYSNFDSPSCPGNGGTVDACLQGSRGAINEAEARDALFNYNSAHMERHASNLGLGGMTIAGLTSEVRGRLGLGVAFGYTDVQVAGSGFSDAATYAGFLRRLLAGSPAPLQIASWLGQHAVCTLPTSCTKTAYSPTSFDWQYSLGHWVENDAPSVAQGLLAYSSAGALGFYPWVDTGRRYYGIIARQSLPIGQQGFASAVCGRAIRLAFFSRVPQP